MANITNVAAIVGGLVENQSLASNTLAASAITASSTIMATGAITAANFSGSSSGTNTGDQTITLTGDVTGSGTGSFAATIAAGSVTLAKMANLAANSVIGNNTGSSATPVALTETQLTAMINAFTSSLSGAAPASGGGTTNFLRADGTWAAPSGAGTVSSVSVVSTNGFAGTVANATTTPAITISTTITGILQGNGTAISAATAGTDYVIPSGSITGTASNITATTNSTLTSLTALTSATSLGAIGTQTQALNMGSNQINNLAMAGSPAGTDATNVTYVTAQIATAINGLTWKGPVQAFSTTNVPLSGSPSTNTLTIDSYSVQNGDYVILSNQTTASQNNVYVASGIGGTFYTLSLAPSAELTTAIGDAYLIEKGTVWGNSAVQANAISPNNTYIQFAGPNTYSFTAPLALTGNVVSLDYSGALNVSGSNLVVQYDNSTIGLNGSDQLYIPSAGITSTQLANGAVTAGAISSGAVDEATIIGGLGTPLFVANAPLVTKTMVAGQTFTAHTSYLVRLGLTAQSETANRVYAADNGSGAGNAATIQNFWVIGVVEPSLTVNAGSNITVTMLGSFTLGSVDAGFTAGTEGAPVWLDVSGGLTTTAPSVSGSASVKVGTVQTTGSGISSSIMFGNVQLTGIN